MVEAQGPTEDAKSKFPHEQSLAVPPLPVITPESAPFWESCAQGRMRLQRCARCTQFWYPPSSLCPECLSSDWSWTACAGTGSIFTYVIFRRLYHPAFANLLPYVIALVELDEGPRMLSRLVDVEDLSRVRCGLEVTVSYEEVTDNIVLPLFKLSR